VSLRLADLEAKNSKLARELDNLDRLSRELQREKIAGQAESTREVRQGRWGWCGRARCHHTCSTWRSASGLLLLVLMVATAAAMLPEYLLLPPLQVRRERAKMDRQRQLLQDRQRGVSEVEAENSRLVGENKHSGSPVRSPPASPHSEEKHDAPAHRLHTMR